jgi:formate C-acetyltransferase
MDQLITMLEANFEGYEVERQILINHAPKWGNDDPYVDGIARDMMDFAYEETVAYKNRLGYHFETGIVPAIANVPHGEVTCALPSGRKEGTPLADGVSPYTGYDKNGPTAIIKSVCAMDHSKSACGNLLNMKLSPAILKSEQDKKNLIALMRTESDLGGYHVQFNVVSNETLRDAQEKPEEYSDLLVRVAGYSAYFVELRKDAQEAIIARTEQETW